MSLSLRRAVPAVALALAASALVAPAAGAQPSGGDLYTATAAGGTLTKAPGKATYRLTLKDPAAKVSAFSDRPARTAATQTLKRFVGDWKANGFAADPPNAALVLDQAPAAHDTYMFELSRPRIAAGGDLTFTAKRIGARPAGALEPIAERADRGTPRGFGRASLFIDGSGTTIPLSIDAIMPPDSNAVLEFGTDTVTIEPSASWRPTVTTQNAGSTQFDPTGVVLTNSAGKDSETVAQLGLDHQGSGPITGVAIIPSGATVTISVNGGAPVTIANGPFSIPT